MTTHRYDHAEPLGREAMPAPPAPARAPEPAAPGRSADEIVARLAEWEATPPWAARADRRTFRAKFGAGVNGLKHAVRGDSSFFAHAYRALLIALTAALLGVGPLGWCLIAMSAGMVLIAELGHSAIDTLARSLGDPEAPGLKVAREIATAGVLVAVVIYASISITILTIKLGELLGWWS